MDVTRLLNTDQAPGSRRQSVAQTSASPSGDTSNDESRFAAQHSSQQRNHTPFSATSSTSRPWSREKENVTSPVLHAPATPGHHVVQPPRVSSRSPGSTPYLDANTILEPSPRASTLSSPWTHRAPPDSGRSFEMNIPASPSKSHSQLDISAGPDQNRLDHWNQKPSVSPRTSGPGQVPNISKRSPDYSASPATQLVSASGQQSTTTTHQHAHMKDTRPPPAKKRRLKPPPIWAQQCRSTTPLKKAATKASGVLSGGNIKSDPEKQKQYLNGVDGPLGPWEPTFTNVIPYEELTRALCDVFFMEVVFNEAFEAASGNSVASDVGAIEIEAKIGTLIDRNTNQRLNLPIQTETMIREDLNVTFESNMTLEQHARFNERLNEAVKQSKMPSTKKDKKPRISMDYKHVREVDHFLTLPRSELSALPAKVREQLQRDTKNNAPRLRITRDQKTGRITAKIIKVRLKDFHIYSPRTPFDWRISISLEINWDGDVERLSTQEEEAKLARYKDRMSYKHLFSQIDLTQVSRAPGSAPNDILSWELEVEVAADEVRRQGKLAAQGQENQYEELVKSFVDNVRILARTSPESQRAARV